MRTINKEERFQQELEHAKKRDEERNLEIELKVLYYVNHPKQCKAKRYKKEYPNPGLEFEYYYRDQAINISRYGYVGIMNTYLEYGIKQIDKWFSEQIRNENCKFSKEELTNMIKKNPHLHNVIKTNLLENLERIK
jgi:hypothetical protein